MTPLVLLIDDEPATCFAFSRYLSKSGFTITTAASLAEARKAIATQRFEAILLDLDLPDGSGLDWIIELREMQPDVPVIVITGIGDVPSAVEAMRRGADHFLTKPVNMTDLQVFLRKSLELGSLRRRSLAHRRLAKPIEPFFGDSAAMKKITSLLKLGSENESTVLLQGETGTGKGVFARWIHSHSQRGSMPFVEVNCSSLRGELLSSELFGHARGAFTSAVETKPGLLDVADGGTLFLDEIGDMDITVQSQFLKVLEEKRYRRLGEVRERRSDFRLICASNHDLLQATSEQRVRKDLYFRINVLPIEIPPLRNRLEDITGLVGYILVSLGASSVEVAPQALRVLVGYAWPGNIRELRNVLERAILLSQKASRLTLEDFPGLQAPHILHIPSTLTESDKIKEALLRFDGDKTKAAAALGISKATLYRKLKNIEI